MKIGIITYHRVRNYGSVLQSYALHKYLKDKGYDVEIIQYEPFCHRTRYEFLGAPNGSVIKKLLYVVASFPLRMKVHRIYKNFRKHYLSLSANVYFCKDDFLKKGCEYDVYITGSDQCWNSRYNQLDDKVGYAYYLDFTDENKKRIGYSVSFGEESFNLSPNNTIEKLVNRYHSISVREKSGLEKLKSLHFDKGFHTLDPTFLLDRNDWSELFGKKIIKKPYLLIYDPQRADSEKFRKYAQLIARKLNLKIVKISKEYIKPNWVDYAVYPNVNQWLTLVDSAEYVLTNSFHGMAFCVNFKKQFLGISANSANNRVVEFLELTGLENRYVNSVDECEKIIEKSIDYDEVYKKIELYRQNSEGFLKFAIEDEK